MICFLWCYWKKKVVERFFDMQALIFLLLFVCLFVSVASWLYTKPAQSITVGQVMRVRGIKNKDINPVCLSLALSREVRLRFARLPLRPLCLSRDMLCLFAEAGPSKAASAQCVQLHRFTNTFLVGRQAYMAPASIIWGWKSLSYILV